MTPTGLFKLILGAVIGVVTIMFASCSATTVDTGKMGVKVRFGQVEETVPAGFYWLNPFTEHMHEIDIRTLKLAEQIPASTKDVQTSYVTYVMNYSLNPSQVGFVYRQYGEDWEKKIVSQVLHRSVKDVFGQYDALDLISKRSIIGNEIEHRVTDALAKVDVTVTSFQLTDIAFTAAFQKAIEDKVIAQQRAVQEQNKTVQVEQVAKQTVIAANAEAQSMQIRAHALESNPKLVEWEAVQHWDGHLPTYMLGGATPFINVTPTK